MTSNIKDDNASRKAEAGQTPGTTAMRKVDAVQTRPAPRVPSTNEPAIFTARTDRQRRNTAALKKRRLGTPPANCQGIANTYAQLLRLSFLGESQSISLTQPLRETNQYQPSVH